MYRFGYTPLEFITAWGANFAEMLVKHFFRTVQFKLTYLFHIYPFFALKYSCLILSALAISFLGVF